MTDILAPDMARRGRRLSMHDRQARIRIRELQAAIDSAWTEANNHCNSMGDASLRSLMREELKQLRDRLK